jgi:hypothetical protein
MNTAIFDTNNGMVYKSISIAVKETGCKSADIKHDCDRFRKNKKIIPRFVFLNDMDKYIEPVKE